MTPFLPMVPIMPSFLLVTFVYCCPLPASVFLSHSVPLPPSPCRRLLFPPALSASPSQPLPQHASLKAGTSSFLFTSASTRSSVSVTQWLLMFVEWMMIFLVALFSHESYAPSAVE